MKFPQTIDTFQFQTGQKRFLLDISSQTFLEIAELASDLLRQAGNMTGIELFNLLSTKYNEEEIKEVLKEIEFLKSNKICLDSEELASGVIPQAEPTGGLSCLAINLTWSNNQNCSYPYGEGARGEREGYMTTDTAHRALDFFIENSGPRRYLTVTFFGGEPLLNFETLKYTVLYGDDLASKKGKKIDYTLITNGNLLSDDIILYMNEHNVHVQVIVEGRKEIHDKLRPPSEGFSYENMIDRVKALNLSRQNNGKVRSCITGYDINLVSLVKYMREMGFKHIYLSPLFAGGEFEYVLKKDDLKRLEEEYLALADYYIKEYSVGSYFGYEGFNNIVKDIYSSEKRHYYCGAGKNYLAIDPQGNIYPCHRFLGFEEWCMGNIFKDTDREKQSIFKDTTVETIDKCGRCWARYLCGGGCYFRELYSQ